MRLYLRPACGAIPRVLCLTCDGRSARRALVVEWACGFAPCGALCATDDAGGSGRSRTGALDPGIEMNSHTAFSQYASECGPDPRWIAGKYLGPGGEQIEAHPIGIVSRLA